MSIVCIKVCYFVQLAIKILKFCCIIIQLAISLLVHVISLLKQSISHLKQLIIINTLAAMCQSHQTLSRLPTGCDTRLYYWSTRLTITSKLALRQLKSLGRRFQIPYANCNNACYQHHPKHHSHQFQLGHHWILGLARSAKKFCTGCRLCQKCGCF